MESAFERAKTNSLDTWRASLRFLLSNGEYWKEKVQGFPYGRELASSGLLVVCAKRNSNEVVAACGIRSIFNVLFLYVEKAYRGHRLGSYVLREAIRAAVKRRLNYVTLSVSSANAVALHLYIKAGFREIVYLEKSRVILMMLPVTFFGKIAYVALRAIWSLFPNTFLSYIHSRLYIKTL